ETVRLHLEALRRVRHSPSLSVPRRGAAPMNGEEPSHIYRMLALVALEIARQAGLDPAAAERTRKTLVTRALTPDVAATRRRKRSSAREGSSRRRACTRSSSRGEDL